MGFVITMRTGVSKGRGEILLMLMATGFVIAGQRKDMGSVADAEMPDRDADAVVIQDSGADVVNRVKIE